MILSFFKVLAAKNDSKGGESPSNSTTASSSSMASAAEKRAERMKRLKELHLRRVKFLDIKVLINFILINNMVHTTYVIFWKIQLH